MFKHNSRQDNMDFTKHKVRYVSEKNTVLTQLTPLWIQTFLVILVLTENKNNNTSINLHNASYVLSI